MHSVTFATDGLCHLILNCFSPDTAIVVHLPACVYPIPTYHDSYSPYRNPHPILTLRGVCESLLAHSFRQCHCLCLVVSRHTFHCPCRFTGPCLWFWCSCLLLFPVSSFSPDTVYDRSQHGTTLLVLLEALRPLLEEKVCCVLPFVLSWSCLIVVLSCRVLPCLALSCLV
jgi:hypothetical protein